MENLILLSRISFNTDILETNIINIALLIAECHLKYLDYSGKEKTLKGVQNAEQRLQEASERLLEAKTQLSQSKLIISKVKSDKEAIIRNIAISNRDQAFEEVKRQANSTKLSILYQEQQALQEVKEQVSILALTKVLQFCRDQLKLETQVQLKIGRASCRERV